MCACIVCVVHVRCVVSCRGFMAKTSEVGEEVGMEVLSCETRLTDQAIAVNSQHDQKMSPIAHVRYIRCDVRGWRSCQ